MTKRKTKHGNIITLDINDDAVRMKIRDYRIKYRQNPDYLIVHPDMYKLIGKEYSRTPGQLGPMQTHALYGIPIIIDARRNSHEFEFYSKV